MARIQLPLNLPAEIAQIEAAYKIDKRNKNVGFRRKSHPARVLQCALGCLEQIIQGDDHDQRGILEGRYQYAHRWRNHNFECLR